jgi:glycerol kinase
VEHDADEIWSAVSATIASVTADVDVPLAAIGLTNQRETVVAWSRSTGRPKARAIVWQDRRTARYCDQLAEAGRLPLVRERTGLVVDPYFSATKVHWWFEHGVLDRGDPDLVIGTIDSWLVWKLTGGTATLTDTTNASRTLLFDIGALQWSAELADLFTIPLGVLPEVVASSGRLARTAAGAGPLPQGVPICGIAGDQQAALFGQACFEIGMTKNTYGTGSFVLMNVGGGCPPVVDGLLTTVAWTLPAGRVAPAGEGGGLAATNTTYAYEGAIFVTGAAVQWLRDGLGIIADAADIGPLAASVPDSGGVVLVPAFTGLGAPWWDPYARGTIVGLTRGSNRAHLARATVEAMALQTRDVVEAMSAASGHAVRELRVDGGAAVMDLLLQIQADQLGVAVTRPTETETTALGAAALAGLGAGLFADLDEIAGHWQAAARFEPTVERGEADALFSSWRRAVERSRRWAPQAPMDGPDDTTAG